MQFIGFVILFALVAFVLYMGVSVFRDIRKKVKDKKEKVNKEKED